MYIDPITHETCSEDRQNKTIAHSNQINVYEPLASAAAFVAISPATIQPIDDDDDEDSTQLTENFNETTIDDDLCERVSFFLGKIF